MKKLLIYIFSLIAIYSLRAQATKDKGIQLLMNNKSDEAISHFDKSIQANKNNSQAHLGRLFALTTKPDPQACFAQFVQLLSSVQNKNPYLFGLWSESWAFSQRTKLDKVKLDFLLKLLEDPKIHGTLKSMSRITLGYHYQSVKDIPNRDKQFAQVGNIDNWSILGTFDNTSGSGYNKDWGVVLGKGPFVNQDNYPINWFIPPAYRHDRWFDFEFHFDASNKICYAQSYVKSPSKQKVYLRAGCSGSIKVWSNDALIISESIERNCDMDIYAAHIYLNEGYNRIVVQVGESETNNSNFLIRITDENGNPISGLSSVGKPQTYKRSLKQEITPVPFEMETYFENLIKNSNASVLDHLVYANLLLRNDKVFESRKVLKKIKEENPNSSIVSNALIEAYQRDNNRTDQTREIEELKKNDSQGFQSLLYQIEEANEKEDLEEYENLINKLKELYGNSDELDLNILALYGKKKMVPELIQKVKDLYKKNPDNRLYVQYMYDIESNQGKDLSKANKILEKYLDKNIDYQLSEKVAYNYFKLNKPEKGIGLLNERVKQFPHATGSLNDLMEFYYETQDYNTSLQYCDKILQLAPYSSSIHKSRGKIYEALKNKTKANESFQTAIKLNPRDYDSRKEIRKLNNLKDMYDYFPVTDAKTVFANSPKSKDRPDNSSILLIYDTKKIIYEGGASESRIELLVKVFNQQGIDTWKEYEIGYNGYSQRVVIETAEVLKKDGSKQKAETENAQIAFTDLTVDDAIHLVYKIENYYSGRLAQHNWDIFSLQYFIPSEHISYHILAPKEMKLNYKELNGKINSKITDLDNQYKLYSWNTKSLEEIKSEPFMPPMNEVAPTIVYSTIPDWKYVSSWYDDLSSELAKQDFEVKETVMELLKGKESLSDYDKAQLFYEFIVSTISYSNIPFLHGPIIPQKASTTLRTKQGDCKDVSTLFVAMCKEANLDANLILVNTVGQGRRHLELPSVDFNHCIAQFHSTGKSYFVELTDQKLPFAALAREDCNGLSLAIPKAGGIPSEKLEVLTHSTIKQNNIERSSEISFSGTDMNVVRRNVRYGYFASAQRAQYSDIGKEKQEQQLSETISSDFSTPIKLTEVKFENLNNLADSVTTLYKFHVKKAMTEVAGFKIFNIPWADKISSPDFVNLETRLTPLQLHEYSSTPVDDERITITLPAGSKLYEKPKEFNISTPLADYTIKYDLSKPGKVICRRILKFKTREVSVADYPAFREFINKVTEADAKPIAIK